MSRHKGNKGRITAGFTLLETLIALGVLGLIMSTLYGSYRAVTDSVAGLQPGIALEQEGRFFLQKLCRQIRCSYGGRVDPVQRPGTKQKEVPPTVPAPQEICFLRGGPASRDEAVLQLVTTSSGLSRKSDAGALAVVSYKVDAGQGVLLGCEEIYGGSAPEDEKDWHVVLRDLRQIELSYFDGKDWQTEWDSRIARGLPRAVGIRLVLESEADGSSRSFAAVAPIWCGTRPRFDPEAERSSGAGETREP